MANPRTPTALKVLADNPSKRPLPENEPEFPKCEINPPDWLMGEAVEVWNKLAPALEVNGMLNTANMGILATYCDLMGIHIETRASGEPPDMKIVQQIRLLAKEFGFTPSSQAGVSKPKKENGTSKSRFFK